MLLRFVCFFHVSRPAKDPDDYRDSEVLKALHKEDEALAGRFKLAISDNGDGEHLNDDFDYTQIETSVLTKMKQKGATPICVLDHFSVCTSALLISMSPTCLISTFNC